MEDERENCRLSGRRVDCIERGGKEFCKSIILTFTKTKHLRTKINRLQEYSNGKLLLSLSVCY